MIVLVVEDDAALQRGLRDNLVAQGYDVRIASDGEAGLLMATDLDPDLILLDLMLPKVNGYEICRALRERGHAKPILMLTAKGQEEDVILGLNLGADDYVTKPFRIRELLARVKALLRRQQTGRETVFRFGPFELDTAGCKLLRGAEAVDLTAKEYKLLEYFARNPGRARTREDILDAVWGRSIVVTGRSVDRCVTTLRSKIEDDPHRPVFIQTVRDVGYRFEPGE